MMKNKIVHIAATTDERYVMPLAAMLYSVRVHLDPGFSLSVSVIENGVSTKSKSKVEKCLMNVSADSEISWYRIDAARFNGFRTSGHITEACYYRVLLPEVLGDVDRVIYLDCDLLVRKDLSILWNTDLKGLPVGAVQGYGAPYASSAYGIPDFNELCIPSNRAVFNSGVMILDLRLWRENDLSSRVLSCCPRYGDSQFYLHDQYALNVGLDGRWFELHPTWNRMNPIDKFDEWEESDFKDKIQSDYDELMHDPAIVHFTGSQKPWMKGVQRHPYQEEYLRLLAESKWNKSITSSVIMIGATLFGFRPKGME